MDQDIRSLERAFRKRPDDAELADRLGSLYERLGWRFRGRTIQEWIDQLSEEVGFNDAADALGDIGSPARRALPALLETLFRAPYRGPHRFGVARAIRRIGVDKILPQLLETLQQPLPIEANELRSEAVFKALNSLPLIAICRGPEVLPALVGALAAPNYIVQIAAIKALGDLQDPDGIRPLLPFLAKKAALEFNEAAAESLGRLRSKAALPGLRQLILTFYLPIWKTAIEALVKIGGEGFEDPLEDIILTEKEPEVSYTFQVLFQVQGQGCEAFLAKVLPAINTPERIESALRGAPADLRLGLLKRWMPLALGDRKILECVIQAAACANTADPRSSAQLSEQTEREAVVEEILAILEDGASSQTFELGRALSFLGHSELRERLLPLLERPFARYHALMALRERALPQDLPMLLGFLCGPDAPLREAASEVLGGLGDPEAVPALARMISRPSAKGRSSALCAISRIPGPGSIAVLMEFVASGDEESRRCSFEALGVHGGEEVLAFLREALQDESLGSCRSFAVDALVKILGAAAGPELFDLLQSANDNDLRAKCVRALGELRWSAALPRLRELRESRHRRTALSAVLAVDALQAEDRMEPP